MRAEAGAPGPSGQVDPGLENQAETKAKWENQLLVGVEARLKHARVGKGLPHCPRVVS